ncbi:MAG: hypothetical protein GX548_12030 [Lentisphaerae bacterium]|nr:hypothetical protein [Lentisphaerota bacterium]
MTKCRIVSVVRGWWMAAGAGLVLMSSAVRADEGAGAWNAPVTLGLHASENETAGMGDLLIPLFRHDRGLVFVNPRASVNDHDEEEINVGLGVRHLFEGRVPFVLGANAYYDGRWTRHGNRFDQLGLGVEFWSDWVDARANYYLPKDDTALVDVVETETVTETRRVKQDVDTAWGDPYGASHEIRQDQIVRLTLRETVVRETLTQVYENREAALEGWDAEIGLRLPLPGEAFQARVFAGYQYFDHPFGGTRKGAMGRLELRALEGRLLLDAQVYENRELNQTDWRAGARVRLPFEISALAQGRNPFAGAKTAAAGLRARLEEMTIRDPKIQIQKSGYVEDASRRAKAVDSRSTTRRYEAEAAAVIAEGITFVDGATGDDANPGTAEEPKATVQGGVDGVQTSSRLHSMAWPDGEARRVVYVQASDGAYAGAIVTAPDIALLGSGVAIPGFGGKAFGGGARPLVRGTGEGIRVNASADGTAIAGFEITTDGGGTGIFSGSGKVQVVDNVIRDNQRGVLLLSDGEFDSIIEGNRLADNAMAGLQIEATGGAGESFRLAVEDNVFEGGAQGFWGMAEGHEGGEARIAGNTVRDTDDLGLWFRMAAGDDSTGDVTVDVVNNTTVNAGTAMDGVAIYSGLRSEHGEAWLRMADNAVDGAGGRGIYGDARGMLTGNAEVRLIGNRVQNVLDMGIGGRVRSMDGDSRIEATGNVASGGQRGVSIQAFTIGEGNAQALAEANRVEDVADLGVAAVVETGNGEARAAAINNQVERSGGIGIETYAAAEDAVAEAWLVDNRVSDCATVGLAASVEMWGNEAGLAAATGNEADRCGIAGIQVRSRAYAGGNAHVLLENNRAENGEGTGMLALALASPGAQNAVIMATENQANFNAIGGIGLQAFSQDGSSIVMAGMNGTTDNGERGLMIRSEAPQGDAIAYAVQNVSHRNANPGDPMMGGGIFMTVMAENTSLGMALYNQTDDNANEGIRAMVGSVAGEGRLSFLYNQASGNASGGGLGLLDAPVGDVESGYNQATDHLGGDGFGQRLVLTATESLELRGFVNDLQDNRIGLDLTVGDPVVPVPVTFNLVFSSVCRLDNQDVNLRYDGPAAAPLDARGNWWGQFPPDPALIVQVGAGTIDSSDAQPDPPPVP